MIAFNVGFHQVFFHGPHMAWYSRESRGYDLASKIIPVAGALHLRACVINLHSPVDLLIIFTYIYL